MGELVGPAVLGTLPSRGWAVPKGPWVVLEEQAAAGVPAPAPCSPCPVLPPLRCHLPRGGVARRALARDPAMVLRPSASKPVS